MSEKIELIRNVFNKQQFEKTVDTSFSQLTTLPPQSNTDVTINIDDFFNQYSNLFYDIPKQGETNSHEYLINTSQNYTGNLENTEDIQPLLDEIDNLREQLITQQEVIQELTLKK